MISMNTRLQVAATAGLLIAIIACGTSPSEVRKIAKEELGLTEADICSQGKSAIQAKLEAFTLQHCGEADQTDKTPFGVSLYRVDACYGGVKDPKSGQMVPVGYLDSLSQTNAIQCTSFSRLNQDTKANETPEKTKISQQYDFEVRGRGSSVADGHAHIWAQSTQQCTKSVHRCTSKPKDAKGQDGALVFLSNRNYAYGTVTGISVFDYSATGFGYKVLDDKLNLGCSARYGKVTGDWVQLDPVQCKKPGQ